jgi:hypothetical protein
MYNSFSWINFDCKEEFSNYNRKFYYLNKTLDCIFGPIKFTFLGENIIQGVKYININIDNKSPEVLDSRLLFSSKEEALEFISRGKTIIPQGPSFSDMNELMCSGYPWW